MSLSGCSLSAEDHYQDLGPTHGTHSFPVTRSLQPFQLGWTAIFFALFVIILSPGFKWRYPKIGVPKNGWFIMESPTKIDDLEVAPFMETLTCRFHMVTNRATVRVNITEPVCCLWTICQIQMHCWSIPWLRLHKRTALENLQKPYGWGAECDASFQGSPGHVGHVGIVLREGLFASQHLMSAQDLELFQAGTSALIFQASHNGKKICPKYHRLFDFLPMEYLPTFARTKSPSLVGKYTSTIEHMEVSWNSGPPKSSSIFMVFSTINHPAIRLPPWLWKPWVMTFSRTALAAEPWRLSPATLSSPAAPHAENLGTAPVMLSTS